MLITTMLITGAACDQDPFGVNYRTVRGDFALHRSAEGGVFFYLVDRKHEVGGYGALRGTVRRIGWNERYIVVWQNADSGREGWMIVDTETSTVEGPIVGVESDSRVKGIVPIPVEAAWDKLESRGLTSNLRLNPTVSSVTGLAYAMPAPALPAGQPRCWADQT